MKKDTITKPGKNRFDIKNCKTTMNAVVTTGSGGYEKLDYRCVPIPEPGPNEVLLQVLAAGINNTEINTRLGWYSSRVTTGTESLTMEEKEKQNAEKQGDGGWNEATPFPFIQGTDCCGRVISVPAGYDKTLVGSRVLVRPCMRINGWDSLENIWMASDFDGAFAQFVKVPVTEIFPVACDWSNAELGTIPCAYGTAENMLHRTGVAKGEHVLIAGASGGVGSAAVQLAKRRGAVVTAIAGKAKLEKVKTLGADKLIARGDDIVDILGENAVDVVVDNVAGDCFGKMLKVLKRGGRFVSSGAIAGPLVALDMRDLYLKDLKLTGCTAWDEPVFPNLISYIEKNEIKPLLAKTFPLKEIVAAQKEFIHKKHVGKFVLIP
ncbi:NADPH:quinone reductase [Desulfocicer vacuolatum DSM 3385]|uniref:NADPH:quinone reductase n=1 Tax=Desulfocicer vacuolatum DSM 3385 TaxID=1121400 RepID=A0A1W2CLW7_9BACT|nr:alcohol dehydrogenase family protein [Desulfocicer vacuolatum]SMC86213.1 NADPH:quinone reductase [Desulfocicer vacuolatum DSM 3385]